MGLREVMPIVAPLLISTEKGYLNRPFCKSLLYLVLRAVYYMDKVGLTSQGHIERRLAEMGLLNRMSLMAMSDEMPLWKESLMQMRSYIQPVQSLSEKLSLALPRIASGSGTSNRKKICGLTPDW